MVLIRGVTKKVGKDMLLVLNKEDAKKYGIMEGQVVHLNKIYLKDPRS